MVIDYLACGIDPEKTIIFTHSAVPALNQLMLPFLSLCTEAELMRNPTVKAEQEASGHALTGLLLTYPVHQACDILFCKGNIVPVGKDQLPHIEQTRQIARRFNERYGHVFPEPHGLLTDAVEIPGLDGRKMSKSYGNSIALSATAEETAKLIKKSKTDSERFITFDKEGRPGVSALLTTAALCTGRTEVEIAEEIGNDGSGALKKFVTEAVNNYLAPIRARRAELEGDMDYIRDVLADGNRRANEIADQTLGEVREAMGMVYCNRPVSTPHHAQQGNSRSCRRHGQDASPLPQDRLAARARSERKTAIANTRWTTSSDFSASRRSLRSASRSSTSRTCSTPTMPRRTAPPTTTNSTSWIASSLLKSNAWKNSDVPSHV